MGPERFWRSSGSSTAVIWGAHVCWVRSGDGCGGVGWWLGGGCTRGSLEWSGMPPRRACAGARDQERRKRASRAGCSGARIGSASPIHAGRSPQPPIHYWAVGAGRPAAREASSLDPASRWFCGPKGLLHSGIFAFLLDMTHLYAVVSSLPAGAGCTTAELSVRCSANHLPVVQRSPRAAASFTPTSATLSPRGCGRPGRAPGCAQHFSILSVCPRASSRCVPAANRARAPATGSRARLREPVPHIAPVGTALSQQLSGLEILAAQSQGRYQRLRSTGYGYPAARGYTAGVFACPCIDLCRSWTSSAV